MRGVVFDFNGTLFWDTDKNEAAWNAFSLELTGRTITPEAFLHLHGKPNEVIIAGLLGRTPDAEEMRRLSLKKELMYREMCLMDKARLTLAPGAESMLAELCRLGVPHGIATSADRGNMAFYFEHLGLGRFFTWRHITLNDGTRPGKPAPDFYLAAARSLGLEPGEVTVVEDMPIGIEAARAARVGRIVGIASDPGFTFADPSVYRTIHDFETWEKWI